METETEDGDPGRGIHAPASGARENAAARPPDIARLALPSPFLRLTTFRRRRKLWRTAGDEELPVEEER